MGDVDRSERGRSQDTGETARDERGPPGKRPRAAVVQRQAAAPAATDAAPVETDPAALMHDLTSTLGGYVPEADRGVDVSAAASAAVGSAFGPRADGIDFAVGGGAADAIGANAVTTDRKVDFAPGQFDVASPDGKARLGEETAHAVQQATPGEPSTVDALEGEAKRAGQDFAAGQAPSVTLAAPAGVGLADDPKAPATPIKNTDPSTEVPDLLHGEVTAIKAVLATNRTEALKLMLAALQRIDAAKFASTDLDGAALHASGGSSTVQGPKFEAWLEANLDAYATAAKKERRALTAAEIRKSITATPPPADKKDVRVEIGTGHFKSASLLYSTVRHEFIHVAQLRANFTAHLPSSVMPSGVSAPDSGTTHQDNELEAYLWEMENLARTGLTDPGEIHLLWEQCSNAWLNAGKTAAATFGPRFKKAFAAIWRLGIDAHIAELATLHAAFKKGGTVDDSLVRTRKADMGQFWSYRNNHGIVWAPVETRYDAAVKQADEMLAVKQTAEVTQQLDDVDAALKAGYTDALTAYQAWWGLVNAWNRLDATARTPLEARAKITLPAVWDKAFTLYEARITALLTTDVDAADTLLVEKIGTLWTHRAKSFVVEATYAPRKTKLDAAVAKAKTK